MQTLARTPLYEREVAVGARMVPFAGFELPVQFVGVIPEHVAVRTDCGVFDVSHMGQLHVEGPNAHALLQGLLSNDLDRVGDGGAQYTLLTNEHGGIVDDLIAYRLGRHHWLLVVNAANRAAAYDWLKEREVRGSEVRDASDEYALLAVQGPRSLERLGLREAPAFTHAMGAVDGIEAMVCRTGYTGEVGVELLCPAEDAVALWDAVVARGAVPCGLGARDTLRLEARLCLYGNDIDETTTPYEAALAWAVKPAAGDFIGKAKLLEQKAAGLTRKLIGFRMEGRGIARHGYPIVDRSRPDGEQQLGTVTSGGPAITAGGAVGMGYVPVDAADVGNTITIDCRGKDVPATIVKGPFYRREEA